MRLAFYDDPRYKQKQAEITRKSWKAGLFNSQIKFLQTRNCKNTNCQLPFKVKPYDPKKFCSHNCAASYNNRYRIVSLETKGKIAKILQGSASPYRGLEKVPRIVKLCQNCQREFRVLPYLVRKRKFCSNVCAMKIIGGQTTSPKASKGKSGIRPDIDSKICFYSTWEANLARVFNLLDIKWEYAPKIFDLGVHTYRPDFYLPKEGKFIEVKNFMNDYSLNRDKLFREKYHNIKLEIISKVEYKLIEEQYRPLIDTWE